jgi:hypothetical protein
MKDDVRFIWGLPQEDSFMKLKELVTSAPVVRDTGGISASDWPRPP